MNTIEDLRNDLDSLFNLYPFLRSLQFTIEDEEGVCSIENRYRPVISDCSAIGKFETIDEGGLELPGGWGDFRLNLKGLKLDENGEDIGIIHPFVKQVESQNCAYYMDGNLHK